MKNRLLAAALLVLGLGLPNACSHQLVAPPARVVMLESAAPVTRGETALGVRSGSYASIWDPGAIAATGGVRHGVADRVEVNAEASYARVMIDGYPDIARDLVTARGGAKVGGRTFAATGGMGGGYAPAAGGFTAVDLGVVAAFDNCYVVPFFAPTFFLSVPVNARTVDFGNGITSRAHTSYGFGASTGIEIPLNRQLCREQRTAPRLQLGANLFSLYSSEGSLTRTMPASDGGTQTTTTSGRYGAIGLAVGLEFPL